jgi:hypothetical protein
MSRNNLYPDRILRVRLPQSAKCEVGFYFFAVLPTLNVDIKIEFFSYGKTKNAKKSIFEVVLVDIFFKN